MSAVTNIRDLIVDAQDPWSGQKPKNSREKLTDVSHIFGGLYISDDSCFVETFKSNSNNFESIISACGFARMQRAQPALAEVKREEIEAHFQDRKVEWLQIGDAVPDDKHAWTDIVFNATFPKDELARADFEIARKSEKPEDVAFRAKKRAAVQQQSSDTWFTPTFDILRAAVNGKKTLVHCHGGVSRSSAVVAAFFIKEYGVPADRAVAFLRTKRFCVDPKCVENLREYARLLQKSPTEQ